MNLYIKNGNITDFAEEVDVIVNAWNRNFLPSFLLRESGVSKAIRNTVGKIPFQELENYGLLKLGEAVKTSSGHLTCKPLIHVAGINALWRATEFSIRQSVSNALRLLVKEGYKSIALPLIGSGTGHFGKEKCLHFIKEECNKFKHYGIDIYIINYEKLIF
ncbi:macro domain-containing protein [Bacillus sp. CGMCC 1.60114]|uniref:macro domain-containing protein n=1 Tax=unclassified Bacillus (in: firmicutes) TaxID=185979 RepID=UPI00363FCD5B